MSRLDDRGVRAGVLEALAQEPNTAGRVSENLWVRGIGGFEEYIKPFNDGSVSLGFS